MKKFLVILLIAVVAYLCYKHPGHLFGDGAPKPSPTPSGGTDYFKQPLDRTHEVIDQVKKQRREDNY